jgi:hypothetical protein
MTRQPYFWKKANLYYVGVNGTNEHDVFDNKADAEAYKRKLRNTVV